MQPLLRDLPWLLLMRWSQVKKIDGVEVRVFDDSATAADIFLKTGESLRMIASNAPKRYARLQQDMPRVLFTFTAGGQYMPRLGACRIGIGSATRSSPLELAMVLVHEATHARLWRCGYRYEETARERIERICVNAEIDFASKIRGAEPAIERTRELLETRWWTEESLARQSAEDLRALGCPRWLARILGVGSVD